MNLQYCSKATVKCLVILFTVIVLFPGNAHAYIDPGSGSMILQLLLAGVAGAGMVCKLYWRRFTGLFRKSQPSDTSDQH